MVGHGRPAVKDVEKEKWSRDDPINVSHVENFSIEPGDHWIAAFELDQDGSVSEVGGHGKVCYTGYKADCSSDVVEDDILKRMAMLASSPEVSMSHEAKCTDSHEGRDSPVKIRAMRGDVDVRHPWVVEQVGIGGQGISAEQLIGQHLG